MERVLLRDLAGTYPGASEHADMRGLRMSARTKVRPYNLLSIFNLFNF